MNLVIPAALGSVIILSFGALIVLFFTTQLTRNTVVLTAIGTVTLIVAMLPALVPTAPTLAATAGGGRGGRGRDAAAPERRDRGAEPEARRSRRCCCSARPAAWSSPTGDGSAERRRSAWRRSRSPASTLVALSRGVRPLEAAFKYFVLAADLGGGLAVRDRPGVHGDWLVRLADAGRRRSGVALAAAGRRAADRPRLRLRAGAGAAALGSVDAYTAGAPSLTGFVMAASKVAAVIALSRLIGPLRQGLSAGAAALGRAGRDRADLDCLGHVRGHRAAGAAPDAGVLGGSERRLPGAGAWLRRRGPGRLDLLRGRSTRSPRRAGVRGAGRAQAPGRCCSRTSAREPGRFAGAGAGAWRCSHWQASRPCPGFWAKLAVLDATGRYSACGRR